MLLQITYDQQSHPERAVDGSFKNKISTLDIVSNLAFWSRQINKLEALHIHNNFQQQQKPVIFTELTDSNFLG